MVDVVDAKARISDLTISDGTTIRVSDEDILVIVGPNNAGKSQFLRDVEGHFNLSTGGAFTGKVVTSLSVRSQAPEEIFENLQKFRENESEYYSSNGVRVHQNHIHNVFNAGQESLSTFGHAAPLFMKRISSDDRLSIVAPSDALEHRVETPGQLLYDNEDLLDEVSKTFRQAFGRDIFLDYRAGGKIPFYTGQKPKIPRGKDRVSNEYVSRVRSCDKLHEQGDGMKSFGGILLSTMVVKYNITLIDEPEAFLHPPQEKIIGRIIGQKVPYQVFCSTHSKNVLQGFLESGRTGVRVLRLTRDANTNNVSEISPNEIKELWHDPVFRYSTALEALFHERAVLCEADPDCRFFEAIQGAASEISTMDTHYIPCGGKNAFPKFIVALKKLSIPVLAILDLDVLNTESTIKAIYEAQGGKWTDIRPLWNRVDKAVRAGVAPASVAETKLAIEKLLAAWEEGAPPQSEIVDSLKRTRPWGKVKDGGVDAVPSGDAQNDLRSLLDELAKKAIFPLPVGELENFVRTVGNHGIKWLNEVFSKYSLDSSELRLAREFMKKVLA